MALTVVDDNADYQASLSPVGLKLESDLVIVTPGAYASITIEISDPPYDPVIGHRLYLSWENESQIVVYTVGNTLDTAGTVIRPNSLSLSLAAYTLQVISDIERNPLIDSLFTFSAVGGIITMTARNRGIIYNVNPPSWAVLPFSFFMDGFGSVAGIDDIVIENLSALTEIYVENVKNSGVYDFVAKLESYPFNEKFKFDLSSVLNSVLQTNKPTLGYGVGFEICPDSLKKYYLKCYEKYGKPAEEQTDILTTSPAYILKAHIGYRDWKPINQKVIDRIQPLNFLTNQNYYKKVRRNQPEFIAWICNVDSSVVSYQIKLAIEVTYTDNTYDYSIQYVMPSFKPYDVIRCAVGYEQIDIEAFSNPDKTVLKYMVTFIAHDGTTSFGALSNDFYYELTEDIEVDINYYIFANALGDYDTLCCTGELVNLTETEKSFAETNQDYEHSISDFKIINYNNKIKETRKQSTGFKSKEEIDYLMELFSSKEVYQVINDELVPISITTKSIEKYKSQQFINGFDFEFNYAFTEDI